MTNFTPRTARTTRKAQGGFTLLEMLVTVGIMAAVAGTATMALQDTTARASAAAHVAMMDELNEGARVFRAMPSNSAFPNNFDSLLVTETAGDASAATLFSGASAAANQEFVAAGDLFAIPLGADVTGALSDVGITALQYVDTTLTGDFNGDGATDAADLGCTDVPALINSRSNAVVAGNMFMTPAGNGCGISLTVAAASNGAFWTGGEERLTGQPTTATVEFDGTNLLTADSAAFLAVGFGPASTLFDTSKIGGLTSVPVYRHVAADQYNRFIGILKVGTFDGSGGIAVAEQVQLITVVDGAGDTKEEELGEWDGTRNTI